MGHCPRGAISIVERQADPFDEKAVAERLAETKATLPILTDGGSGGGCPGLALQQWGPPARAGRAAPGRSPIAATNDAGGEETAGLANWPVQLRLVPPQAPFLDNADVLLVADCVPFAYAGFHRRFLDGRPVVIGCPKLDDGRSYVQKLGQMIREANLRSITVLQMEVPCCAGLLAIARAARDQAESEIPVQAITVTIRGALLPNDA